MKKIFVMLVLMCASFANADVLSDKLDSLKHFTQRRNNLLASYFGTEDINIPAEVINEFNYLNIQISRLTEETTPIPTSIFIKRNIIFTNSKKIKINILGRGLKK